MTQTRQAWAVCYTTWRPLLVQGIGLILPLSTHLYLETGVKCIYCLAMYSCLAEAKPRKVTILLAAFALAEP